MDLSSIGEVDGLGGEPVLRDHLPLRGIELRERARPVADEADVIGPGRKVRHRIAIRLGAGEQEHVDAGAANQEVGLAAAVEGVVAPPPNRKFTPTVPASVLSSLLPMAVTAGPVRNRVSTLSGKAIAGQDFRGPIACGRAHEVFEQSCYILGAGVTSEQGDAPER